MLPGLPRQSIVASLLGRSTAYEVALKIQGCIFCAVLWRGFLCAVCSLLLLVAFQCVHSSALHCVQLALQLTSVDVNAGLCSAVPGSLTSGCLVVCKFREAREHYVQTAGVLVCRCDNCHIGMLHC